MVRVRYRGDHSFVHNEHGPLEEGDVVEVGEYTFEQFDQMFVRVDANTDHTADDTAETPETDEAESEAFDAEAFVDRTPMSAVVEDIESGEYDAHLDAIAEAEADARDRQGVADAIEAR